MSNLSDDLLAPEVHSGGKKGVLLLGNVYYWHG